MFDQKGRRKYLNGADRAAFLNAAMGENEERRRAFLLTLFYTGCRVSEALNVIVSRIDLAEKAIVFETLKRRKDGVFRAVPIPESLVESMSALVNGAGPSVRTWQFSRTTAFRLVKLTMKRAGITGGMTSPKGLRHGFAIACIGQKIPLTTVKKWLGHARLETTAIYLDVAGDEERELAKRLWKSA